MWGQFFVAWVRSVQPSLVWVWVWKISPKNPKLKINFLPLGQKKSLWVVSKSTRVGLLFTVGQKYTRVRSGPNPAGLNTQPNPGPGLAR